MMSDSSPTRPQDDDQRRRHEGELQSHKDQRGEITERDQMLIESYIDDRLSPDERREFEARLAADAPLRQALDSQLAITERIQSIFAPPSGAAVFAAVERAIQELNGEVAPRQSPAHEPDTTGSAGDSTTSALPRGRGPRRFSWAQPALAAALTIGALGVALLWLINSRGGVGGGGYQPRPFQTLGEVYASAQIEWQCEPGPDFYRQYYIRYDEGLLIPEELPSDINTLGFGYANSLSQETIYLVAEVEGERVIVFADKAANAGGDAVAAARQDPNLHLFERRLDGLILYELSPLDQPRLLEIFFIPESVPQSWIPGAHPDR